MKILLIAGHGQGDPGACGCGYKEADLTREAVKNINTYLKDAAEVEIFDLSKDMFQCLKLGSKYPFNEFDYVFEVHFNALNGKAYGTEVLVHQNEQGTSVETEIVNNIASLGFSNRGVKRRADLRVMNNVKKIYGVSHALVEICFIDNKNDMEKYIANKQAVAKAIADGIKKGFGIVPKEEKKALTSANDIIWELSQQIDIDNVKGAVSALKEAKEAESPLYWLLYKVVNK